MASDPSVMDVEDFLALSMEQRRAVERWLEASEVPVRRCREVRLFDHGCRGEAELVLMPIQVHDGDIVTERRPFVPFGAPPAWK